MSAGISGTAWSSAAHRNDCAREREVALPRGEWIETWSGRSVRGSAAEVVVEAPLERVPVWVRSGSIVVT